MGNIALIVRYSGTAYHGWQVQKTEISVAQTLERGLSMVCGEPVKVTGCGRTDAGVHALKYALSFRCEGLSLPLEKLPLALNFRLPPDIRVLKAQPVPEDFLSLLHIPEPTRRPSNPSAVFCLK